MTALPLTDEEIARYRRLRPLMQWDESDYQFLQDCEGNGRLDATIASRDAALAVVVDTLNLVVAHENGELEEFSSDAWANVFKRIETVLADIPASAQALLAERDAALKRAVQAEHAFELHIEAVKKWTSELAAYLPFMDDGKVTPQDFLVAASAAQQWTGNMMNDRAAWRERAETAEAKVVDLLKICAMKDETKGRLGNRIATLERSQRTGVVLPERQCSKCECLMVWHCINEGCPIAALKPGTGA